MHPNRNETATSTPPEVSQTRRSLLKAAASTAPLIATLPSGAAMAQASAANCVIQEEGEAEKNNPEGAIARAVPDGYIRVDGTSATYRVSGQFVTVYKFNVPGRGEVTVLEDGTYVAVTGSGTNIQQLSLLRLYQPLGNPAMGVTDMCDGLATGGWPAPTPTAPNYCIWPIAKVDQTQPGNLGMTASCLLSVTT